MTKKTHFVIGVAAGMAASLADKDIAMLAAGCLFPDAIEHLMPVRLKHRCVSHWGLAYGLLALMVYLYQLSALSLIAPLGATCFLAGCVLHWLADALTPMGVPVVPGFRLRGPIVTGSTAEYAILCLLAAVVVAIWRSGYEISADHIPTIFGGSLT